MEENKVMPISKLKNGYGGQWPPSNSHNSKSTWNI